MIDRIQKKQKQCEYCGNDFETKGKRRHCSDSCRTMAARLAKRLAKENETDAKNATEKETESATTATENVTKNANTTEQDSNEAVQSLIKQEFDKIWHNRTVLDYVFKNGMKTIHKDTLISAGYDLSYMSRQAIKEGSKHYTYCFDFGLTSTEKQGFFEIVKLD